MILSIITYIVTVFFIALWAYAAIPKLFNIAGFRYALMNQAFPEWVGRTLIWLLPSVELGIVFLLLFDNTRLAGMYLSLFLMLAFVLYVAGAVYGFYRRYPCACGSLFRRMNWRKHLRLNLVLFLLALIGVLTMELHQGAKFTSNIHLPFIAPALSWLL